MSRERRPIHSVAKKAGQLNKVVRAIIGKEGPSHDAQRPASLHRKELVSAASWLDRLTAEELAVYKDTGSVSRSSLYEMKKSFRTLCNEFEGLKGPQLRQRGKPPRMIRSQERLGELVWELGEAINTLGTAMDRRRVSVHQDNSSLEDFEEVRKAWGGPVKKNEAGLTVAEVERAIDLVGEVDLQDSKVKMRFVNLIRAPRTTQEFEMRYRSMAPGRPWVYMAVMGVFPDPEEVQTVRERCQWDGTIHIAATQPTWRIVWQFD